MLAVKTYNNDLNIFRRPVRLMGNLFEISVVGNDPIGADNCIDGAVDEINRVEKLLSAFSDDSQINEINRNAGIKPIKVSAEIYRLVERSLKISELTHGAFDITYSTSEKAIDVQKIERKSVKFTNYKNVLVDQENTTVFLKEKGMRIGFGAISKGYAADRAKYVLQMMGVRSGVINAGGDLLTWGLLPNNEPWTIATADPSRDNHPYADINISNMAVATSGNFEKNITISNKKHPNNLDTKKGFPVSVLKSVSIVSPTAELSDAMATPVMSMGVNAGLYLINQLQQLACIIVDDHDRIYTSREIAYLS
ncbi:FAD:protein FMN transferase [Mucilaginibacter sp. McL0603]|uniref:FAD:protein FMN transferase n=1 Tax=Mucilaginibacter sp. McL0603 TaxID=3415670 RepID=UPI003CF7E727